MKNTLTIITMLSILSTGVMAASSNPKIHCSGQAEYGRVEILELDISDKKISIKYSVEGAQPLTNEYITTEFFDKNGRTDLKKPAYAIGGTKSGEKTDYDDISLPHYGLYKSGLGSEIAFNHKSKRVFGTVSCRQE